jgi:hypothetical protein
LSLEEVRSAVRELGSDRFDERERAMKRLGEAGAVAIDPLAEAARGTSLEVTCRSIRALESIAQRADRDSFEAAQNVLEALAEGKNRSAAHRANVALGGLGAPRSRHAKARIVELGAIIRPRVLPRGIIDEDDAQVKIQVILNRRWKGGEEGLVYLRRIDPAELDTVYVTPGSKLTGDAMAELAKAVPHLNNRIVDRGDAMLGVACDDVGMCLVNRVVQGTAAARCGLKEGDVIVKYDGVPITSFQQLTAITKKHDVGDKIVIEVNRDGEVLELEATLGDWE